MTTRDPAVAGAFYPEDSASLAKIVDQLVAKVVVPPEDALARAYIVPHAGYRYSGPFAAHSYARLRRHSAAVRRVVLIGPAHRVPLNGCAMTGADHWRTPLGDMPIDVGSTRRLAAAALGVIDDHAHGAEHSLEVQVPFLQRVLETPVPILPICVGNSLDQAVSRLIETAVGDEEGTVVICSTDLSHYLPDDQARVQDSRTAEAIMALEPDRIGGYDACGVFALRGLLRWARSIGATAVQYALGNSADTCGDRSRVVGYPAFAIVT